jgi:outer membrane protein assembly factor BamE (lipoprotein component of BamABCDE complex)
MNTESRRSHDSSFYLVTTMLVLAMLACSLPAQSNSPGQDTPANGSGQGSPTSTQAGGGASAACLAGILPGMTTRDEVVALLGEPLAVEPEGDLEYMLYASPFRGKFNSVVIKNQVVVSVSIMVPEDNPLTWSAVKAQYGEPAHTTFSNYLQWSMTYIYPDRGLTFVASEGGDVVYIQECFVPMALEEYMNTWGKLLPTEDPFTE